MAPSATFEYEHHGSTNSQGPEPIAVIGMGCRLPGSITSPSELWELLVKKRSTQSAKVPKSRFNIDAYYHENLERPGSFSSWGGYFLDDDLRAFDPAFFGISPIEAMWMDPQQRKLLEVVYECLESAGVTLDSISGTQTACFVGSFTTDYQVMSMREADFRHSYAATGVDPGLISNRISHVFNLNGPSFTINTACSSSVYALHQACNSLSQSDCVAAIVGGTNLILTVDQHMNTAKLGVLSPTSTCHTFDETADGYGRAEGVGALYLKRLSDALRDGDPIRAVIRGTAVNSNGRAPTVGITHPNLEGQENVIRKAYKRAGGLNPLDTGYFECHGTGTAIGDPLEVRAVSLAMNQFREGDEPLYIGAVKTNLGHSEAASGMSAVIKAVLAVEKGIIPPTIGLKNPNPKIKFDEWKVKVVTEATKWPSHLPVRRASVNSFGYGGTNGHVIVEAVDSVVPQYISARRTAEHNGDISSSDRKKFLLLYSAHDKATLKQNILKYKQSGREDNVLDLSYTLGVRRSRLSKRAFAVVTEGSVMDNLDEDNVTFGDSSNSETPSIAFVFTGQGAQWAKMGAELMASFPSYLKTIRDLDAVLRELPDRPEWSIEDALLEPQETSRIHEVSQSQPLCTAIQIAIVDLLQSWNVTPAVTVGHSSGEIAAAYSAGYLTASEAIITAYYRGKVVSEGTRKGSMLAVGLGATEVKPYLSGYESEVVVACQNSPQSVTLSGEPEAIGAISEKLQAEKIFARQVRTGGKAYHSHHMRDHAEKYKSYVKSATAYMRNQAKRERIPMISSVTGEPVTSENLGADYWCQNLTQPVLFDIALREVVTKIPVELILEIGPHSALAGPVRQILSKEGINNITYVPTLSRGADSVEQLLGLAGKLFLNNYPADFQRINSIEELRPDGNVSWKRGQVLVDLPTYQWNYSKSLWAEPRWSAEQRSVTHSRHDILGRKVPGNSAEETMWQNFLRQKDLPWLAHHQLGAEAVFPAAGYWAMAVEAITQLHEMTDDAPAITSYTIRDVSIKSALVIPDNDDGVEVLFSMRTLPTSSPSNPKYGFSLNSFSQDTWTEHSHGNISLSVSANKPVPKPHPYLRQRASGVSWYEAFADVGFRYGSSFQGLRDIRTDPRRYDATATTDVSRESGMVRGESRYTLHPASIDACLQLVLISIHAGQVREMTSGYVPVQAEEITIHVPSNPAPKLDGRAFAWTDERGLRSVVNGVQLSVDNELLLDISKLRCVAYEAVVPQKVESEDDCEPYWRGCWKPDIDSLTSSQALSLWGKNPKLSEFLGYFAFKYPSHKILDICDEIDEETAALHLQNYSVAHKTQERVSETNISHPELTAHDEASLNEGSYDLIVARDVASNLDNIRQLLKPNGKILAKNIDHSALEKSGFSLEFKAELDGQTLLFATAKDEQSSFPSVQHGELFLVGRLPTDVDTHINSWIYGRKPAAFISYLEKAAQSEGWFPRKLSLKDISRIPEGASIILLLDLENVALSSLEADELDRIKQLFNFAGSILWVTNGGLLDGKRPENAMPTGLARSVRSEQAAINLTTIDFELEKENWNDMSQVILSKIGNHSPETEFLVKQGVVHINRVVPHEKLNAQMAARRSGKAQAATFEPGKRFGGVIKKGLGSNAIEFYQQRPRNLSSRQIEVGVKAIGVNVEDERIMNGHSDSALFIHEFSGIVSAIGPDVTGFKVGDYVVGLGKDRCSTHQAVSVDLCRKIYSNDFNEAASIPIAYISALYALAELARLQENEKILIFNDTGAVGQAAFFLARLMGANIFVAANGKEEKKALAAELKIPSENVILLTDDFSHIAKNESFDVVLSAEDTQFSQETWRHIAAFGKFVTLAGKKNSAAVNPTPFTRGAGYFSFSIQEMYDRKPKMLASLLNRAFDFHEIRRVAGIKPLKVFDLGQIDQAFASSPGSILQGKKVISYATPAPVNIQSAEQNQLFRNDASYLLIGCLGGLGRSLTTWMIENGAKHLIFMSRSGTSNPEAAKLVRELEAVGTVVKVLCGDVSVRSDVEAALQSCDPALPIRGIIQAAMVLEDKLFDHMTMESWTRSIRPKVKGTKNLHDVFRNEPLDFFVMTSSTSAVLGTPGQSNYSAANNYLDSMARHRRSLDLPAVSLILPMVLGVGYVSEHPEIEEALTRKGIYGIDETELLEAFEKAIFCQKDGGDYPEQLIAGMEPSRLAKSLGKSKTVDAFWLNNPRLTHIRARIDASQGSSQDKRSGMDSILNQLKTASQSSPDAAIDLAIEHIIDKISRLLLVSADEFDSGKTVAYYGLDSMIGAELRNWIFREFGIDISFQRLLGPTLTIKALATELCEAQGLCGGN